MFFHRLRKAPKSRVPFLPPVTVLKPVCGLEKNLKANLRSLCVQHYPNYQIVFCVQRNTDPALPILEELQKEFGPVRVSVVVKDVSFGSNGKVNNLLGGLTEAKHDVLVISDSDIIAPPDYLRNLVGALSNEKVGAVCSIFRGTRAQRWYEKLELLSVNADFMPGVIFSYITGTAVFCLGPSVAIHRLTLRAIGGLEGLADYLVEDYEIGRRVVGMGKKVKVAPQLIDAVIDFESPAHWWRHHVYWEINTRLANPGGFFFTLFARSVPFALLFLVLRGDPIGWAVFASALGIRLATAAVSLKWGFNDREGFRSLYWLPLRDIIGLIGWFVAFCKNTVTWRDKIYRLTRKGKMVRLDNDNPFNRELVKQNNKVREC